MTLKAELNVEDMSCDHCKSTLEKKLTALEGVNKVSIDLEGKQVDVLYDEERINLVAIKQSIMEEGYSVIEI